LPSVIAYGSVKVRLRSPFEVEGEERRLERDNPATDGGREDRLLPISVSSDGQLSFGKD